MSNPQLIEYISRARERGKTDQEIRDALVQVGWGIADIEEVLSQQAAQENKPAPEVPQENLTNTSQQPSTEIPVETLATETTISPEVKPEIIEQQTEQATGETAPYVPETKPEIISTTAKPLINTILRVIAGLVLVSVLGYGGFYFYTNFYNKTSKIKEPVESLSSSTQPQILEAKSVMAYTVKDEKTQNKSLVLYDLINLEKLQINPGLQGADIEIGSWDEINGIYLPILATRTSETEISTSLVIYNKNTNTFTTIYDPTVSEKIITLPTKFNSTIYWFSADKLAIKGVNGSLTTIDTSGNINTEAAETSITKYLGSISYQTTQYGQYIQNSVKIYDKVGATSPINFTSGEILLGKVGDRIATRMTSNGKDTINIYNTNTGKLDTQFNLVDSMWDTKSVVASPTENYLIAHQTNKAITPTKERFIKIFPDKPEDIKTIFVGNIVGSSALTYGEWLKSKGITFYISEDGKWIITERGYTPEQDIYGKNIESGEEEEIVSGTNYIQLNYYMKSLPQKIY